MTRPSTRYFKIWEKPKPTELGNSVEEFLNILGGPTLLIIPGRSHEKCRAVSTLLHGNEPSGVKAMFHWLKHGEPPKYTLLFFISSVQTALQPPGFYYRQLPGKRDLNRCFRPPFDQDDEGRIAEELLGLLEHYQPNCVIDIHNTSGKGADFSVSTDSTPIQIELASFFTHRMIVTDLRLGALSDLHSERLPIVTVECGGSVEENAHDLALEGLTKFAQAEDFSESIATDHTFELLRNPVRIELEHDTSIDYLGHKNNQVDFTLLKTIEEHNFGIVKPFHQLGWTHKPTLKGLKAINSRGQNVIDKILEIREGELFPARPIKIFMATTNPLIARSDCLFYAVDVDGTELVAD